ncbi:MAG TPA: 4-alpha-glucanotransferase, partial [Candidatus Limnocylindria bacterium]|nr:4-alpha-glucanotransferase [Candidatus Limnocylindria bacterium]
MNPSGVEETYTDAFGKRRTIDADVRRAVEATMGDVPDEADAVAVVPPGARLPARGELTLEDGTALGRGDAMPPDAPFGYHSLLTDDGVERLVITGPGRCHLPAGLREWGWAIQLAATRSARSWGIGDLADLSALGRWSADIGAGFLAVSPLGAPNPGPDPEPSPYYPSTRRWGNPLHISVDAVPSAARAGDAVARLRAEGRALNADRLIDRREIARRKLAALEAVWRLGADRQEFDEWRAGQSESLEHWATFTVITERHGPGWQRWPEELRRPGSPAVARVADAERDRVAFHAWIQWCFDRQLADASRAIRRIADMPVGVDPGGFDAWEWQEQLALDASVGAPPDRFNTAGQDWGLPPFVPARLRAARYRPFIETIRAQLRHAGGLRIDHVLGLFRLWWMPRGADPSRGAYVRADTDELLEIVALESYRAQAIIVGEDLGTVPAGVRRELRRRRLLSTRLALFERKPPERYPRQSFAGVTTHDLPTIAGIWSGADLADQRAAGVEADASGMDDLRARLSRAAGLTT